MTYEPIAEKRVLIVEDEPEVAGQLSKLVGAYLPDDAITVAGDAGAALRAIDSAWPSVLVLDLMMPYGEAAGTLKGASDPLAVETGIGLVEWIRSAPRRGGHLWIAVVTARSDVTALSRLHEALGKDGWVFHKPFSTALFEVILCEVLGITCKVSTRRAAKLLSTSGWRGR
jgi:CheY-like chemotaxis protein